MQDYRRLKIWPRSCAQAVEVRNATKRFPKDGFAELKRQMTTAAESIVFNIVEGCGSRSQKEFARFLDIAIKSAFELESQISLAADYGIIPNEKSESLSNETVEIRKLVCGLQRRVLEADANQSSRGPNAGESTKPDKNRHST
jgi:S23 ribosomal protein.